MLVNNGKSDMIKEFFLIWLVIVVLQEKKMEFFLEQKFFVLNVCYKKKG